MLKRDFSVLNKDFLKTDIAVWADVDVSFFFLRSIGQILILAPPFKTSGRGMDSFCMAQAFSSPSDEFYRQEKGKVMIKLDVYIYSVLFAVCTLVYFPVK